jgi:hypothetical protein
LYILAYRAKAISYTDSYLLEPACYAIQRPRPKTMGFRALIKPLDFKTWTFALVSAFFVTVVCLFSDKFWWKSKGNIWNLGSRILYSTKIFLSQSHSLSHTIKFSSERIIMGTWMLAMLVICSAYSGILISFFTVTVYPSPANSIEEVAVLAQANHLQIHICCNHVFDAMKQSSLESQNYLAVSIF